MSMFELARYRIDPTKANELTRRHRTRMRSPISAMPIACGTPTVHIDERRLSGR